jgi:hypothetical protein
MKLKTDYLAQVLDKTMEQAQAVVLTDREYLQIFGFQGNTATVVELWKHITERLIRSGNVAVGTSRHDLDVVLTQGTLSQRIVKALGTDQSQENIIAVYKRLSDCLAQNKMFLV